MIRLFNHLTPFVTEIFRVRRKQQTKSMKGYLFQVLGFALVMFSLIMNYFLFRETVRLYVFKYNAMVKIEGMNEIPGKLQRCEDINLVLSNIIDQRLDRSKPLNLPENYRVNPIEKPVSHDAIPPGTNQHTTQPDQPHARQNPTTAQRSGSAIERHRQQRQERQSRQTHGAVHGRLSPS